MKGLAIAILLAILEVSAMATGRSDLLAGPSGTVSASAHSI